MEYWKKMYDPDEADLPSELRKKMHEARRRREDHLGGYVYDDGGMLGLHRLHQSTMTDRPHRPEEMIKPKTTPRIGTDRGERR